MSSGVSTHNALRPRKSRGFRLSRLHESRAIDRADRQARWQAIYAHYQQPWPWWFLGSCLVFAGLCLIAGIKAWPHVDSYALLVGGTLFLVVYGFKAWAQTRARQEPLPEPPAQQ